jgi:hypothetical protein
VKARANRSLRATGFSSTIALMRKTMAMAWVAFSFVAGGARADGNKHFEIKAGSLELTNSMMKDAVSTMYFDDFGERTATVTKTHMTMMGQTVDAESWSIVVGGYAIRYDNKKKTGSRSKQIGRAQVGPSMGMDAEKLAANAQASKKDLPAKTVAGKSCKGMEVTAMGMTIRAWTWKGLPCYSEMFMGGLDKPPLVVQTTKLDESAPPPTVFTVPADVKITDR